MTGAEMTGAEMTGRATGSAHAALTCAMTFEKEN